MSKNVIVDAKFAKDDEFYTRYEDIAAELSHYEKMLEGKIIYCNCDDCYKSAFVRYFVLNFNRLNLKGLIASNYVHKDISIWDSNINDDTNQAMCLRVKDVPQNQNLELLDTEKIIDLIISNKENSLTPLESDGDFLGEECLQLLKQADIVITNPPFSLFIEFIELMYKQNKLFLIIGNKNAVTYATVFPHFMNNSIQFGYNKVNHFTSVGRDVFYKVYGMCQWFTNLPIQKENSCLLPTLTKHFVSTEYPMFDYYNAINVDSVKDIPVDYYLPMAVPITFLNHYNPREFKILSARDVRKNENIPERQHLIKDEMAKIGNRTTYARIVIKRIC